MDNASKVKWQIRAAVLAIFFLGFVAGALSLNAYHTRRSQSAATTNNDRFDQMLNRLQLTPEQRAQVEKILNDMRGQLLAVRKESAPKVGEIRRQTDDRLRQVLTPSQWEQFQQMKSELRRRRGRDNDGRPVEERR
jgi:Spy/CpxP family protein refolding chaperone